MSISRGATVRPMVKENSRRIGSRQRVKEIIRIPRCESAREDRACFTALLPAASRFSCVHSCTLVSPRDQKEKLSDSESIVYRGGLISIASTRFRGKAIKSSDESFDASRWIFFGKGGVQARKGRLNGSLSYSSSIKARLLKVISRRVARWLVSPR